jgi:hypothetical protein
MHTALTKKLAEAMDVKPDPANNAANPIFSWTTN